ncbi:MAG: MFS transporter [Agathobacter sp.]
MGVFKSMNFGVKGWILLAYQFLAFIAFTVFTNWPMNILADMYGGAQAVSSIYTIGAVIAIVIQLVLSAFIGKIKSIKAFGCIIGAIAMIFAMAIMVINPLFHPEMLGAWKACYLIVCIFVPMWATFSVSVLVGQWFPTRKGAFMGIATLAFPITNGLIGSFAGSVFGGEIPNVFGAFLPYWIICLIGLIIGIIVIKDYPEQCGAYRDNNKDMTPEMAEAMLKQDIENKRTSVWKTGGCLTSRDFWFATIPLGGLLLCSVGVMTQTNSIIGSYGDAMGKFGGFAGIMLMVMIFGILGSFIIGLIDQAIGTKKAVLIACIIMLISGLFGIAGSAGGTVAALILLAVFMGASSNFTVSMAAQYWRREDFSSVFSVVNPVANIIQAVGPAVIAILMAMKGTVGVFGMIAVWGVLSVVLILVFSPKHIKKVDDKRREKVGKVLDDALVGRK